MELEPATSIFKLANDPRPKIIEPPPVMLVAVADVVLHAPAGLEKKLDAFYVDLLRFERDTEGEGMVYRAENFRLRFVVVERPLPREDFRAIGIVIPSLDAIIARLLDAEIEFTRQRGVAVGSDTLLMLDPGGNFVEISEIRRVF